MSLIVFVSLISIPSIILGCFHSENFICSCSSKNIECIGSGEDSEEVKQLFLNISASYSLGDLNTLTLNMSALEFPSFINFTHLPIKTLNVISRLKHIESDLFSEAWTDLETLKIQDNNIAIIDDLSFNSLYNLSELYLDNNEILEIKSNAFMNLNNLKVLSLSMNLLNDINESILQPLFSLQTLILEDNNITSISNESFVSVTLKNLYIQKNQVTGFLEEDTLSGVPNLIYLDLSSNHLKGVNTSALSALSHLQMLNASMNDIQKLNKNAFSQLLDLETLDLSRNKIQFVPYTVFSKLYKLKKLDLHSNMLLAMLCLYTIDLHALEYVDLRSNFLKSFQDKTFSSSPNLRHLFLRDNPLDDTVCPLNTTTTSIDVVLLSKNCIELSDCTVLDDYEDEEDYSDKENDSESTTDDHVFISSTIPMRENNSESTTDTLVFISSTIPFEENDSESTTDALVFISSTISIVSENETINYLNDSVSTEDNLLSNLGLITNLSTTEIETTKNNINVDLMNTTYSSSYTEFSENPTTFTTRVNSLSSKKEFLDINSTDIFVTETESSPFYPISNDTFSSVNESNVTHHPVNWSMSSSAISPTETLLSTTETFSSYSTTDSAMKESSLIEIISTSFFSDNENDTQSYLFIDSTASKSNVTTLSNDTFPSPQSKESTLEIEYSTSINTTDIITPASERDTTYIVDEFNTKKSVVHHKTSKIHLQDYAFNDNELCIVYNLTGHLAGKHRCSLRYQFNGSWKSESMNCPKNGSTTKHCKKVNLLFNFCLVLYVSNKRTHQDCSKDILMTASSTEIPTTTVLITTLDITTKKSFMPSTDAAPSNSSFSPEVTHPSSTKFTKEISITKIIPFQVLTFNVFFNDSNSGMASWNVNRQESFSHCNLTISLNSTLHYSEFIFPCLNSSFHIKDVKTENIKEICLVSLHKTYGKDTKCKRRWVASMDPKTSDPVIDATISKQKDHGFKNSSLVALSILLLIVLAIIITLIIRNLLKKRLDRDRYNVYYQEQTVSKRMSSLHSEPNVRYSFTPKE